MRGESGVSSKREPMAMELAIQAINGKQEFSVYIDYENRSLRFYTKKYIALEN